MIAARLKLANHVTRAKAVMTWFAAQGPMHVAKLITVVRNPGSGISEPARIVLDVLIAGMQALDERVLKLDAEISSRAKRIRSRGAC